MKSTLPLPLMSTALMISRTSASVGRWPSDRIMLPSSAVSICPTSFPVLRSARQRHATTRAPRLSLLTIAISVLSKSSVSCSNLNRWPNETYKLRKRRLELPVLGIAKCRRLYWSASPMPRNVRNESHGSKWQLIIRRMCLPLKRNALVQSRTYASGKVPYSAVLSSAECKCNVQDQATIFSFAAARLPLQRTLTVRLARVKCGVMMS